MRIVREARPGERPEELKVLKARDWPRMHTLHGVGDQFGVASMASYRTMDVSESVKISMKLKTAAFFGLDRLLTHAMEATFRVGPSEISEPGTKASLCDIQNGNVICTTFCSGLQIVFPFGFGTLYSLELPFAPAAEFCK